MKSKINTIYDSIKIHQIFRNFLKSMPGMLHLLLTPLLEILLF